MRIAQVRRDKEAAIDVQDFGQAAVLRDTEKQLIEERVRLEQEAAAGTGAAGGAGAGSGPGSEGGGELGRLRARVADLEARLREHGIDPDGPEESDEPGEPPAATG
ncbi:MAG TPA: UvrB/UvrC motif-containing protein [Streptosporangiaceae bacterium]|nr:UvrB/UvrC motif-containing protein [Streptosporangiaceae bacterium]